VVAYVSLRLLDLPAKLMSVFQATAIVTFFLQVGLWLAGLVEYGIARYREKRGVPDPAATEGLDVANAGAKFILWSVVLLVTLDNLGVNVTALVTGLGVGGVAVALALQNILGDLFSSLSITIDKPFVPGDFIVVGDQRGTVKAVGMKTTRLTALSGEELVFSNSELLKLRIQNFRHMRERRVVFTFGVTYQTPHALVERIPSIVRQAIERHELTRFDRAHFYRFGESSLDFEVVYFVLTGEYNVYMDIHQAVNLEIMREFESKGIEFAYPTRTLWMSARSDA
jgi:small-conductance mechanosensitive channel